MRILFLSPIGNIGGAERVLLTAMAGLRRECPDAVVRLVSLSEGPLAREATALGADVEVVRVPAALGKLGDSQQRGGWWKQGAVAARAAAASLEGARTIARLRGAIRRFAPDLIHSNGIKTHLLSRWAAPRSVPVVWHAHDFYGMRPLAARLLRGCAARVRVVVAVSNSVASAVAAVLPGVPIATVPNAIDLDRFAPGEGDGCMLDRLAQLPEAPRQTLRVGLVATYARWKGHLTVLDAAASLEPSLSIRWYIVGGPIYHTAAQFTEDELRQAVRARGLEGRVGFIGFTPDTPRIYRALDVVVHASTSPEPFGLTIAEGMACGRPVVVSRAGGAAELFVDDVDALSYRPGDATQLADRLRSLANDPERRARLGAAARQAALARFDDQSYGAKLLAVYRRLGVDSPLAAKTT